MKNKLVADLEIKNANFIKLLNSNNELCKNVKKLSSAQNPKVAIICCSDSRVIPEEIFQFSFGEVFVIRTAGNVINDGELATLEYAIKHLKIDQILVLGHTNCGAIHAAAKNEKGEYLGAILDKITKFTCGCSNENEMSLKNAKMQAQEIKDIFNDFKLNVIYGIYDLQTLKVSLYE